MNHKSIAPGFIAKASASLLVDGGSGLASALRAEGEPCCGLGVAEEESVVVSVGRRRERGASILASACDYRLHIGI